MKLPVFNRYMNFSYHHLCCFIVIPLFVLDKSMAWNRCLQHPTSKKCVKLLKPPKFRFQCPTLPFGFATTFMISLHVLCTPRLPIPLYCHE
jgi:hypothetical protein